MTPIERFWNSVLKTDGCWNWTSARNPKGYGYFNAGASRESSRCILAHRFSWELHSGVIPDNLCVLHKCDNPGCVRPDHLFLGTRADNNHDMCNKGRHNAHWPKGEDHPKAKITMALAEQIRTEYSPRVVTRKALASRYNVSESLIGQILDRTIWNY